MKKLVTLLFAFLITSVFSTNLLAQDSSKANAVSSEKNNIKHGLGFVDEDGDGYNDNAPDHDGDGIPNGLDQDYKNSKKKRGFVDLDGDGINDNRGFRNGNARGNQMKNSKNFGNKGVGPKNGNVSGIGNNDNMGGYGKKEQKGKGKQK